MTPSTNELLSWLNLYERIPERCPSCCHLRPGHDAGCELMRVLREVGYASRVPDSVEP